MMCVRRNGGERLHQRGDHDHRAALRAAIARDGNDRRWLRRRQLPVPGARVLPGRSARRLQAALAGMGHRHHGRRVSTCRLSAECTANPHPSHAKPLPPQIQFAARAPPTVRVRAKGGSIAIFAARSNSAIALRGVIQARRTNVQQLGAKCDFLLLPENTSCSHI